MKIHIIAAEGSPVGVTEQSIYGIDGRRGVGGAELGILTLCRLWHDAGHDVTFYNNPDRGGSEFKQAHIKDFHLKEDRDILICFRSPNHIIRNATAKRKIWYSNDQFTSGDYAAFAGMVDTVVCISEHHAEYFRQHYGIMNARVVDIPVRTWEYVGNTKKQNSCMYTSVPDRGLIYLAPMWKHIVGVVPDATLTITGDWSLWNNMDCTDAVDQYRRAFAGLKNVRYLSAVSRKELIDVQNETELFLYPHVSQYPELYCISLAEAQVAGAIPITSRFGAMETTNRFGHKIDGHPQDIGFRQAFIDKTIELLLANERRAIREEAKKEFGHERILAEWDKIFEG